MWEKIWGASPPPKPLMNAACGFQLCCGMFMVFFSFLFRIVRIRRRRKVHVRYISSVMSFLLLELVTWVHCGYAEVVKRMG